MGVNKYRPSTSRRGCRRFWTSTTPRSARRQVATADASARAATRRPARRGPGGAADAAERRRGNLLGACRVEATRARATVGEISSALEKSSDATAPSNPVGVTGVYGSVRIGEDEGFGYQARRHRILRRIARAAARACWCARWAGRPRPRRQGDRHRLRRHRLRRRYRAAVPDPGGSRRSASHRKRRTRDRRVQPGRRRTRPWCRSSSRPCAATAPATFSSCAAAWCRPRTTTSSIAPASPASTDPAPTSRPRRPISCSASPDSAKRRNRRRLRGAVRDGARPRGRLAR